MVEKLYISYQQMEEDCKNFAERVSKLEPKITKIVAITRGGMYPALMLAQYLNIKNIDTICLKSYTDDNKRGQIEVINDTFSEKWDDPSVLFIDDLFDSGNTIAYIGKKFKKALKATIYYKNKSSRRNLSWLSFFQAIVPDTWLVFPFGKDPIPLETQEIIEEPKEIEKAEETIQFFQPEDIEKEFLGGIFLGKSKYKHELEELEIVANPTFTDIPYEEPKPVIDNYDDDDWSDDWGDDCNIQSQSSEGKMDDIDEGWSLRPEKIDEPFEEQITKPQQKTENQENVDWVSEPFIREEEERCKKDPIYACQQKLEQVLKTNPDSSDFKPVKEDPEIVAEREFLSSKIKTISKDDEITINSLNEESNEIVSELQRKAQKEERKSLTEELAEITLSQEQKNAIALIMKTKKDIILTGKAGAGKSTIIKFLRYFNPSWAVCSTTGKASVLIDGTTVDRLFCIDRTNGSIWSDSFLKSNMRHCGDVIIIDEASMIGKIMFHPIRKIAATFGKRLVFVGDWGQAAPVKDDWFFPIDSDEFEFIKLTECWRQNGGEFLECLDKLRVGKQDDQVNQMFSSRVRPTIPKDDSCLVIFGTNRLADKYNASKIEELLAYQRSQGKRGKGFILNSKIKGGTVRITDKNYDAIMANTPFANGTKFASGCKVLITKNSSSTDGCEYCNGDTGYLIGARACDGEVVELTVLLDRTNLPVTISRKTAEIVDVQGRLMYTYEGFPIKVGYAMTAHKCQGMTIPKIWVDIESIGWMHTHGLVYVALSRVRKLEDLYVSSWYDNLAVVDEVVRPYL
jgi:hypoxanthine phosphoribosyltransferase